MLRLLTVPAAALAAMTIAACGSSAGGSVSTTSSGRTGGTGNEASLSAGAPSVSAGVPATAPSSAAGSGTLLDVCSVLPIAKLNQITGKTFSTTKARTAGGFISECEYGGGSLLLQVNVLTAHGQMSFDEDVSILKQIGHPPVMVSGVGDAAFSLPDPNGNAGSVGAAASSSYGAVFGQAYIKIGGFPYVNAQQGKQICTLLAAAL